MQFWFKIYCAEHDETRIFWLDIPHHKQDQVIDQLKRDVRYIFKLPEDFDFYFTHKDKDNDEIAIKENYEILNYMCRMENNNKLKLSVTPLNQERQHINDTDTSDNASVNLSESFQSIIKNLELGMSNLQATVEKNAVNVAASTVETVMKTAAETAAQVYRSMLPPPTHPEKMQFDVICDGCYTPIRGQRWRCETCEDFDLCSTCKSRVIHEKNHNFRSIKNIPQHTQEDIALGDIDTEPYESKPLQTIFICDYCDSDIVGIRHTCGACPDFDLCHSCFSIVKENHPEHIFVTRLVGTQANICKQQHQSRPKKPKTSVIPRQSADTEVSTVYHRGVNCDNCQDNITGIRYKCGHCVNYDLCETCEEYALSIHDKTHAFIKIRYPIQSIIKRPILPKFMPLGDDVENHFSAGIRQAQETIMIKSSILSVNETVSSEKSVTTQFSSAVVEKPNPPSPEPEKPVLSAAFVSDINIPDGTLIVPKKTFIKMWKIRNNGTTDWPIGTHLLFNGGTILRPHPISRPDSFVVPVISPNEDTCITAELQAPDCPGNYSSYFCLCTPNGVRFGDVLWCSIKVDQDNEPAEITRTLSASDIMMNSSNSMIYPTISTSSTPVQEENQSNEEYTDQDGYSVSTSDHISTINSNLSYSDSHVSSPASSEIDIGERRRDDFLSEEETDGVENKSDGTTDTNPNYQIVQKSNYQIVEKSESTVLHEDTDDDPDEDFIMIDSQEENNDEEYTSKKNSNNVSLSSSMQSSRTVTLETETISDEILYRSQLLQLHEMGFTTFDDLAINLLKTNEGRVEVVIAKLLYYP